MSQTILIVDDKRDNLLALESILAECKVHIIRSNNGREALEIMTSHDISLVLVDVQMPEMDGFEMVRLMKGQTRTASIPVIFITGIITDEQHILEGYRSGAVDYIVKPIDPEILINKVNVFLSLDSAKKALVMSKEESEEQKTYFESILTAAGDGILGLDQNGIIQFCNPAALQALQYTRDALIGKSVSLILTANPEQEIKFQSTPFYDSFEKNKFLKFEESIFYKSDKKTFPVSVVCSPLAGAHHRGVSIVFSDISVRKMLEQKLVEQARTDALTGLANRSMFVQSLTQSISRSKRIGRMLAVLFIDLDRFKQINDIMGHEAGDQLLTYVSERIVHAVRLNDTVARLGGDEFTVLVEDILHEEDGARVAEKIMESLRKPFVLNNNEIFINVSIGISTFPRCGDNASSLMRGADVAMYRVKASGRNGYQYFTPEMNQDAQLKLRLEQELRQALDNNQLEMYYQPIIGIGAKKITAVEALLRWNRKPGEVVGPQCFIPILEETGLIVPFGKWILWMSCLQASHWLKSGVLPQGTHMCVNISAKQFSSVGFFEILVDILNQTGLDPHMLELEMTESFLISDSDQIKVLLQKIKDHGVHLAIDDFGTGYSSLSYLKRYPVDVIKIDRSFINELTTSSKDRALVQAIVDIGHALDFNVLVEGVETNAQLALLEKMGADTYQGYYMTPPLPATEFVAFLREKNLTKG
jgi:diguanylate cyclase (GGDEF)-like protein/PAS domain S-box-containing protein